MFVPGPKVTRVNLKPLIPEGTLEDFNPERFLQKLERLTLRNIERNIRQEAFSPAAKKRLIEGMRVERGPKSITVIATDPAFRPLLEGQKPGQMRWLVKAQRPIPIVLDSGELIFRSATPQSMSNGSWYHPGRKPTTVIERAKEAARETVKKEIKGLLKQHLKVAMRKRR